MSMGGKAGGHTHSDPHRKGEIEIVWVIEAVDGGIERRVGRLLELSTVLGHRTHTTSREIRSRARGRMRDRLRSQVLHVPIITHRLLSLGTG